MGTILAMAAEHRLAVKGMTVNVSKEMSKDAPRRIIALPTRCGADPGVQFAAEKNKIPHGLFEKKLAKSLCLVHPPPR
jgi:hypothetical protein